MSDDIDDKLKGLLTRAAPPAHDPFFRIAVLEKREQQNFQLRNRLVIGGGIAAAAALILVAVTLPSLAPQMALLAIAAVLAGAGLTYGPALVALGRLIRR